jgi:hypothetical protein
VCGWGDCYRNCKATGAAVGGSASGSTGAAASATASPSLAAAAAGAGTGAPVGAAAASTSAAAAAAAAADGSSLVLIGGAAGGALLLVGGIVLAVRLRRREAHGLAGRSGECDGEAPRRLAERAHPARRNSHGLVELAQQHEPGVGEAERAGERRISHEGLEGLLSHGPWDGFVILRMEAADHANGHDDEL